MKIPYNNFKHFYLSKTEEILTKLNTVLESGKYIRNNEVKELEAKIAKICNRKYAITTASCTDSLFFALKAANIKKGDEVIVPSFSYIASLSPILMCEATPVFADINESNLMINIDKIKGLITNKTKAIIFVQLFGSVMNFKELQEISVKNNITLIEDAAQALGASNNENHGGGFGDISCISFDPTKIVSAYGTGGAILTNNEKLFQKFHKLIHHGRNTNNKFETLGYNSKISELSASLINIQLNNLNQTILSLNKVAERYYAKLKETSSVKCISFNNTKSTFHKFVIIAKNRDKLQQYLLNNGVETRIHYSPLLHEHKLLDKYKYNTTDLSISLWAKTNIISLPIYPDLSSNKIDYICDIINNFYKL